VHTILRKFGSVMLFELGVVVQIGAEKVLFPTGYVNSCGA
jgi:hypothetical protein